MTEPQKEKLAEKLSKKRGVGNILKELADVQFPAEAKTNNKDKVHFIVDKVHFIVTYQIIALNTLESG